MYLFVDVFDKVVQDEYPNDEKCPKRLLTTFYKVNKNIRFFLLAHVTFAVLFPTCPALLIFNDAINNRW